MKVKQRFKNWIFRLFKKQIMAYIPNVNYSQIGNSTYRLHMLKAHVSVSKHDLYGSPWAISDAKRRVEEQLLKDAKRAVNSNVWENKYTESTHIEGSLYVGVIQK